MAWSLIASALALSAIGVLAAEDNTKNHVDTLFSFPVNVTVPGSTAGEQGVYETGWMMNLPGNDTSFGCFDGATTHQWGITEPAVGVTWWNVTLRSLDGVPSQPDRKLCAVQGIPDSAKQVTFFMADSGQNDFIRYFGQGCVMDPVSKRIGCCWGTDSLYWRAPPRGGRPGQTHIWLQCPRSDDITIPDVEDTDRGPDADTEN